MSYVSQQSKLFGFSVPLYPADSYTGVIINVPEDATEILSLKGEMIDFTNITQYSDIVLHSEGDYVLRIRREDTYIHLEILEVSTNQTAVLWWTGFGSNYKWWICASINDSDGNIYLFAVSDTNHAWVNRGTSDHTPISGVSSSGLLIKRFFKNTQISGGGAGSGYIGNSLLSNKKMVGYNVPTSEAESTKTESVEDASASPVSGKPKIGNGHAKIKLVREIPHHSFRDLARTLDIDHKQVTTQWADISPLSQYYNTDYILVTQQYNGNYFTSFDGIDGIGRDTVSYTGCRMFVPIKPIQAVSAKASVKIEPSSRTSQYSLLHLYLGHLENNEWTLNHIGGIQINGTESEWTEISKIFDSPINAEYIVVYSMDNQWHFKNVEITGDLL